MSDASVTITYTDAGTALANAIAKMERQAPRTIRAIVHTGARMMVREPWRIYRVLYGSAMAPAYPIGAASIEVMLPIADRLEAAAARCGRAGHYAYDFNRHVALKQARLALRYLRRAA